MTIDVYRTRITAQKQQHNSNETFFSYILLYILSFYRPGDGGGRLGGAMALGESSSAGASY